MIEALRPDGPIEPPEPKRDGVLAAFSEDAQRGFANMLGAIVGTYVISRLKNDAPELPQRDEAEGLDREGLRTDLGELASRLEKWRTSK